MKSIRSLYFKETRNKKHLIIVENYTRLIANLIKTRGSARICEIAKEMDVSHVNVIKNVKKLIQNGYLTKNSHSMIQLTCKGKEIALFTKEKYLIIFEFLLHLGVPEDIAAIDAEGIKHYISPSSLEAIKAYFSLLRPNLF